MHYGDTSDESKSLSALPDQIFTLKPCVLKWAVWSPENQLFRWCKCVNAAGRWHSRTMSSPLVLVASGNNWQAWLVIGFLVLALIGMKFLVSHILKSRRCQGEYRRCWRVLPPWRCNQYALEFLTCTYSYLGILKMISCYTKDYIQSTGAETPDK